MNPFNILVKPDFSQIKIINFGNYLFNALDASQIKKEELYSCFYMAPEKSGLLNSVSDEKSDLYSLGVIFYHILSGMAPFQGDTLQSVFYQHLSVNPPPLQQINPLFPGILDEIIFKLLEKEPEKRYQSAKTASNDLKKMLLGSTHFLAEKYPVKLNYYSKLVGRENELNHLTSFLNQSLVGKSHFCLLKGNAGIGKTRLVNEFKSIIQEKEALFLETKCFSGENKTPYGPFKDALNLFINQFQNYSQERKNEFQNLLQKKIGDLKEIIHRFNPFCDIFLGNFPLLKKIDPDRENTRFLKVISKLFHIIGEVENGLVLFIDDIHWADEGTLDLLNFMLSNQEKEPLLVLLAARNDENPDAANSALFNELTNHLSPHFLQLELSPLPSHLLSKLIAHILSQEIPQIQDISNLIYSKTKGNPLYSIEILKQLIEEKALFQLNNHWAVNTEFLSRYAIPESIVAVILRHFHRLSPKEILLLSYAAVIGKQFDRKLLFCFDKDFNLSEQEIINTTLNAIQLHLIEEVPGQPFLFQFTHDRIRETFYQSLSEKTRIELHEKIGFILETQNTPSSEDKKYELAHHFIIGRVREKILEYAYPAGISAKDNHANELALNYLKQARKAFLQLNKDNEGLWVHINENIIEILLLTGRNDEAIELLNDIYPVIQNNFTKASLYRQISQAFFRKGLWHECEKYSRLGLNLLGENLPLSPFRLWLSILKEFFIHLYHSLTPSWFQSKKESLKTKKTKAVIWFYYGLSWVYTLSQPFKFLRTSLRMLNLSQQKLKNSEELGMSLAAYAGMCGITGLYPRALKYFNASLTLRTKLDDIWGMAQTLQLEGYCFKWMGNYQKSIHSFKESAELFKKVGDLKEAGVSFSGLSSIYYYTSQYDKMKETNESGMEIARQTKDSYALCSCLLFETSYLMEKGEFHKSFALCQEILKISEENKIWHTYCLAHIEIGSLLILKESFAESRPYLEKALQLAQEHNFVQYYTVQAYSLLAESLIEEYKEKKMESKLVRIKIKNLLLQALRQSTKWPTRMVDILRVEAKYHACCGNIKKADKYYRQAVSLCENLGRPFEKARILYEQGFFLNKIHKRPLAKICWKESRQLFIELKADHYVQKIEKFVRFPTQKAPDENIKKILNEKKLESLIEICQKMTLLKKTNHLIAFILEEVMKIAGASTGISYHPQNSTFSLIKKTGLKQKLSDASVNELIQEVCKTRNTISSNSIDSSSSKKISLNHSFACLPIFYQDAIKGFCVLENPHLHNIFHLSDIEIIELILSKASDLMEKELCFDDFCLNHIENICQRHKITQREKEIILFVLQDLSNHEITEKLPISVKTVKNHLTSIFEKLLIKNRADLKKFFSLEHTS